MNEHDELDGRLRAIFAQAPLPASPDLTATVRTRVQRQRLARRVTRLAMAAALAGVVVLGIVEVKYELIAPGVLDPIYARLPREWQPATYVARVEQPQPQPEPEPEPKPEGSPLPILVAMTVQGPVQQLDSLKSEQDAWAMVIKDLAGEK